jgi:hypothetical protein
MLFQDTALASSFSFLVAAGARIHWRFQMIFILWLLTGPYLHLLVSHIHYVSIKNKKKYSTKLLTFWNDKEYFVQRFELVSK